MLYQQRFSCQTPAITLSQERRQISNVFSSWSSRTVNVVFLFSSLPVFPAGCAFGCLEPPHPVTHSHKCFRHFVDENIFEEVVLIARLLGFYGLLWTLGHPLSVSVLPQYCSHRHPRGVSCTPLCPQTPCQFVHWGAAHSWMCLWDVTSGWLRLWVDPWICELTSECFSWPPRVWTDPLNVWMDPKWLSWTPDVWINPWMVSFRCFESTSNVWTHFPNICVEPCMLELAPVVLWTFELIHSCLNWSLHILVDPCTFEMTLVRLS